MLHTSVTNSACYTTLNLFRENNSPIKKVGVFTVGKLFFGLNHISLDVSRTKFLKGPSIKMYFIYIKNEFYKIHSHIIA